MFAGLVAKGLFQPIAVRNENADVDGKPLVYRRSNYQLCAIALMVTAELCLYTFLIQHSIAADFWKEHTWAAVGTTCGIAGLATGIFLWCHCRSKKFLTTVAMLEGLTRRQVHNRLLPKTIVGSFTIAGKQWWQLESGGSYYYHDPSSWDTYITNDRALPNTQGQAAHFGAFCWKLRLFGGSRVGMVDYGPRNGNLSPSASSDVSYSGVHYDVTCRGVAEESSNRGQASRPLPSPQATPSVASVPGVGSAASASYRRAAIADAEAGKNGWTKLKDRAGAMYYLSSGVSAIAINEILSCKNDWAVYWGSNGAPVYYRNLATGQVVLVEWP